MVCHKSIRAGDDEEDVIKFNEVEKCVYLKVKMYIYNRACLYLTFNEVEQCLGLKLKRYI